MDKEIIELVKKNGARDETIRIAEELHAVESQGVTIPADVWRVVFNIKESAQLRAETYKF